MHFTVRWDVLKADGHCHVSRQGMVKNVDIIKFHNNRKKHDSDYDKSQAGHGFYYDRHIGKCRDRRWRGVSQLHTGKRFHGACEVPQSRPWIGYIFMIYIDIM